MRTTAVVAGFVIAAAWPARVRAEPDPLVHTTVVYARGAALYKADARGRGETQLAALPARVAVRALRTDAGGRVLLADLGGRWSWMPLDGRTTTLAELPCADGPAQLATDGSCVLCRSASRPASSIIVHLSTGKQTPIDVPAPGSRLVGSGRERRLVWADAAGVWSAPPGRPGAKTKVAPEAPLRGFLPSPDGKRAVGVYADVIHDGARNTKPADVLMGFSLDGHGARRKSVRDSVPVEWSHDGNWVLVQDGAKACIVKAIGGQYKCWRGYTAVSIAGDGSYALLLGNRDKATPREEQEPKDKKGKKGKKGKKARPAPAQAEPQDEPQDEPEQRGEDTSSVDDVLVPPPSGPLALFRGKLEGAFTETPSVVARVVEGAAVWIPTRP